MPFEVKTTPEPEIANSSDADLFSLMRAAEEEPLKATKAWKEFYRRYRDYLWHSCLTFCRAVAEGKELAKDIFQATVLKLFEKASSFNPEENKGIKAWISRIAFNEFIDHINKYERNFVHSDEPPELADLVEDFSDEEEAFYSKMEDLKAEQLALLLSCLNPKELKVLMVSMSYYQLDKPLGHLPDSEIKELCTEFNVKPPALRQIKLRALAKLKKKAKELFP